MKKHDEHLNIISGLAVDSDDIPNHRSSINNTRTKNNTSTRNTQVVMKSSSATGKFFLVFFIILLVAACGGLGWQLYMMQQKLIQYDAFMVLANQKLDLLGNEMDETGSSFAQNGNEIGKKIKVINHEIAKLWDVSNKKNKSSIAANKSSLAKLTKQLNQESGNSTKILAEQAKVEKKITKELDKLTRKVKTEMVALNAGVEDHSEQLTMIRNELGRLQNKLKNIPNSLSKRVNTNTESVNAIDAARRVMIKNITDLQRRVNLLQTVVNASPAS